MDAQRLHRTAWFVSSALGVGALALIGVFPWERAADGVAYYLVDPFAPYGLVEGGVTGVGAFRYAPVVALAAAPLSLLSWPMFQVAWLLAQLGCLWYLGRRWALALILFPPVWLDLLFGNINLMLAAAIVAGLRHPALWAAVLLTKVTPGVGLAWFVARREWRHLFIALGTAAALSLVSVVVAGPGLWFEWLETLSTSAAFGSPGNELVAIPLALRVAVGAGLAAFAGRTDRAWLVPIACAVATPVLWPIAFAIAAGAIPTVVTTTSSRFERWRRARLARVAT